MDDLWGPRSISVRYPDTGPLSAVRDRTRVAYKGRVLSRSQLFDQVKYDNQSKRIPLLEEFNRMNFVDFMGKYGTKLGWSL